MSHWECIRAGVTQGSILGPLFFLIHINNLATVLKSNIKLFAKDTSLFSMVSDPLKTVNILNKDLDKIRGWAEEVVFSRKHQESFHSNPYFNKFLVEKVQTQKHLGLKDHLKGALMQI